MALDTSHGQVVNLENSDDRLAAVEEAKRSGEPFRSVGANLTVPVPASTAIVAAENHLTNDDVYVSSRFKNTFPAHLEEAHKAFSGPDGADKVNATNEEKAAQHAAYSANLVRKRQDEDEETLKRMKDGYRPDIAINEANLRRAEEHEAATRDWKINRDKEQANLKTASQVRDEVVKATADKDLISDKEIADQLKNVNPTPNTSESAIKQGLKIKDQIISAQRNFKDSASDPDKSLAYDHPAVPIMDEAGSAQGLVDLHNDHLAAKREAYSAAPGDTEEATEAKKDYIAGADTTSGKEAAEVDAKVNTEVKNAGDVPSVKQAQAATPAGQVPQATPHK